MGKKPGVSDLLVDKTQTLKTAGGIVTAVVLDQWKGPVEPDLCYSQEDFLARWTPNGTLEYGMPTTYWEIFKYLGKIKPILISPILHQNTKFGGLALGSSANTALNNIADIEDIDFTDNQYGAFVGATPGDWHENVKVSIKKNTTGGAPAGSFTVTIYNGNTAVEQPRVCSFDPKAKDGYGTSIFIENQFKKGNSNYLTWISSGNVTSSSVVVECDKLALGKSSKGSEITDTQVVAAINKLKDAKKYKFQYINESIYTSSEVQNALSELCKIRNDQSFATHTVPISALQTANPATSCAEYTDGVAINSYNDEMIPQWLKMRDPFNDRDLWLPAGLQVCANAAVKATSLGYAESAAGTENGVLSGFTDVYYSFSDEECDTLCEHKMNPIVKDADDGIYIVDDKTMLSVESTMSNKTVATNTNLKIRPDLCSMVKPYVKKKNNASTWRLIELNAKKYAQDRYDNEEFYAYLVKCDDENNTPAVVRARTCYLDFAYSPVLPIDFIKVRVTLTPYGEAISELL